MRPILMTSLVGLVAAVGATAATANDDRIVPVVAERIFVPTGFDDNDNAQVVVDGIFPNTCHQVAKGEYTVDPERKVVVVQPMARVSAGPCLQILVPYTYVFELGTLPMGDYRVELPGTDVTKTMHVAEATSAGPDNELYAAIDNAYVMDEPAQGKRVIVLEGMYTNTCMKWDRTEVYHNDPRVIEVLPVVRIDAGDDCRDLRFPFKGVKIDLPATENGRALLHVRSMNGGALNRVFETGSGWRR